MYDRRLMYMYINYNATDFSPEQAFHHVTIRLLSLHLP
jgi:hypothetical protein